MEFLIDRRGRDEEFFIGINKSMYSDDYIPHPNREGYFFIYRNRFYLILDKRTHEELSWYHREAESSKTKIKKYKWKGRWLFRRELFLFNIKDLDNKSVEER